MAGEGGGAEAGTGCRQRQRPAAVRTRKTAETWPGAAWAAWFLLKRPGGVMCGHPWPPPSGLTAPSGSSGHSTRAISRYSCSG